MLRELNFYTQTEMDFVHLYKSVTSDCPEINHCPVVNLGQQVLDL